MIKYEKDYPTGDYSFGNGWVYRSKMQVNESIEDTLTDLACYSVMTLSYLRKKKNN